MAGKVWVVSELYYPEESATGYILTRIAEGVARTFPTGVICGQPSYLKRGVRAPTSETRNGVRIIRCLATTLDKDRILTRAVNIVTLSASVLARCLQAFGRGDAVLVVTNPPTLPYLALLAARVRGAKTLLLVHDLYPEALAASGVLSTSHPFYRALGWLSARLLRSVDGIVALGRDMKALLAARAPGVEEKTVIIPNWGDTDEITPAPRNANPLTRELGLADTFVVLYAGNMGRTHGIETVLEAAREVGPDAGVRWLFVGAGAKRRWLEEIVRREGLAYITLLANRPRADQQVFLNAGDIGLISFLPGMAGISVPSRMYNMFAAGRPVLAMADEASELALVVREADAGWVVRPGDARGLAAAVREAARNPDIVRAKGERARILVERFYTLEHAVDAYRLLIHNHIR